jgi:hypothetical protein
MVGSRHLQSRSITRVSQDRSHGPSIQRLKGGVLFAERLDRIDHRDLEVICKQDRSHGSAIERLKGGVLLAERLDRVDNDHLQSRSITQVSDSARVALAANWSR